QADYDVVLKILNNSSSLDSEFLDEWKYHYNCQKKSFSKFIQFFGFTQDPNNLNYIIVMIIHESNLTHGDFHDGNILVSENHNELFIIDLGLCKPISDFQDSDNNEVYGVLPYMDLEILRNKPYTPASDIYSFSMIMWEFISGIPPFNHEAHDQDLVLSICEGKCPKIIKNTPKCYIDLMKKCWDSNPSNRPTIIMLEYIISEWIRCIEVYYVINSDGNYQFKSNEIDDQLENDMLEFVEVNKALAQEQENTSNIQSFNKIDNQLENNMLEFVEVIKALAQEQTNTSIMQSHPQAYYTSRKLTEIFFQDESEGLELAIKD
ncbi:kinase-like domain-containing protein, partial [Rhizophagus diaphanus]